MTISNNEPLLSGPYNGDGVTTVFDYDFTIYANTDLRVERHNADDTVDVLVRQADYTVAGAGDAGGGTITLLSASTAPTGSVLYILPDIEFSQNRPFGTQSSTTLSELEAAFDKATSLTRQLREATGRSIKLPTGDASDPILPLPTAGATLVWGTSGLENGPTPGEVSDAMTYRDQAEAARDLARLYATEDEDVPVVPGEFSSRHWSLKAEADRVQTGLDRVATGQDRVATGQDAAATEQDAIDTAADRVQTGQDRTQTGLDAQATAADRVQTGLDVQATNADVAAITGLSAAANTLAPSTPATASYNSGTGVLTLGVPKGEPGVGLETVPSGRIVGRGSAGTGMAEYLTPSEARSVMGLGTAATTNASAYATAAQGTKADAALPKADKASTAEARAGTDDSKYMTPKTVADVALGMGQTWQSVTRAAGIVYQNTTGRTIVLAVEASATAQPQRLTVEIHGEVISIGGPPGRDGSYVTGSIEIPAGATYKLGAKNGSLTSINAWELR